MKLKALEYVWSQLTGGKTSQQKIKDRRMRRTLRTMAAGVCLIAPGISNATPIAAVEWAGASHLVGYSQFTQGYLFRAEVDMRVTALGAFDRDGDGFALSHQVGLWTTAGAELASATLGAGTGDTLDGHFRYTDISSAVLTAGTEYIVAATQFGGYNGDWYAYFNDPAGLMAAPGVTYLANRYGDYSTFAVPTNQYGTTTGYFGGNFKFTAVPEPTTTALLALGLLGAGFARKRRTH
jgi:hypothetical protein